MVREESTGGTGIKGASAKLTAPKSGPNSGIDAEVYSKHTQFYTQEIPLLLGNHLGANEWQRCLELGCGDGSLFHALDQEGYFENKFACALDVSETRINRIKAATGATDCMVGDACRTPLKDESFEFLFSSQVIEHVHSDEEMVKEMRRVLAPNGIVYLSTVFKKWYGWYFYRCNGKWVLDPTHLREYNQDEQLLDILERSGLKVLENRKSLDGRPILDAVSRRMGTNRKIYDNRLLRLFRSVRIPIFGYYIWEIVCQKR